MNNLKEYPVKLLREMLEAYSPSGSEAVMASLVKDEMESLGFRSTIDATGNVTGCLGDHGPMVLLCGHLDTVPGEIPTRLEGDYLYGRGAVDAKSSLAAMIISAANLQNDPETNLRLKVAGVVEEETASRGFRMLSGESPPPDAAIFGEPSGLGNMIIGFKGRLHLEVQCSTSGGHAASPWLSKNSAEEAYSFWALIQSTVLNNEAESKFNAITGSLTGVSTKGPENSIPSQTRLSIDIRLPPETPPSHIASRIKSMANTYCTRNEDVKIETAVREQSTAYQADVHSRLVASYRGAIRMVTHETPVMLRKTGTSDMNLLSSQTQAIAYGPGDSRLDHTDLEKISLTEYMKSIEVHTQALRQFSRLHSSTRHQILVSS